MEEVAEVYARALFEVASERNLLDAVHEQLGQFVDALSADRQLEVFFVSPYLSTAEKKDGLHRMLEGAEETFMSFLETLVERQRMPEIFHIRTRYDELWDTEMKMLPVEVTSAVALDEAMVRSIGERIGAETGNHDRADERRRSRHPRWNRAPRGQLSSSMHRFGTRLDQLRKQVAQGRLPSPVQEQLNADQA